jgi:type IV secretion system protein VirD4
MNSQSTRSGKFDVSINEIVSLFIPLKNKAADVKRLLFVIGAILSPVTLAGVLWGYIRAYHRHHFPHGELPSFDQLKPITRVAMILGGLIIWILLAAVGTVMYQHGGQYLQEKYLGWFIFLWVNIIVSIAIFIGFNRWRKNISAQVSEMNRFGNARYAQVQDLADYIRKEGVYIGNLIYGYAKQGHFLSVAGTRAGKFINLIAQNLLGMGGFRGSRVVIDVKGEIAFVTSRYQKQSGQTVLILDPWQIVTKDGATYNPLDLISNQKNPEQLSDDATIIAEMIVPKSNSGDQFFNNRARAMITGLVMHLVTSQPESKRHLGTLWSWLRLNDEDWINLLGDMSISADEIVRTAANEIVSVYNRSEKTFASILSAAQDATDFLKSPSLQKSLKSSNFDINTLSDGKTTLYVVIPPTHLNSQSQWLRLVVTTAMRAVVRNRNKRVLFILDEFAALGYLPEIETALSTYAGYNISVWAILQDLGQLKRHYGENWETFISNTAVRHFFGINDKFTAEYLSDIFGDTTYVTYENDGKNGTKPHGTARRLVTPDEIRRGSADQMFTLIEQKPVALFQKIPYYEIEFLDGRHDPNPYYTVQVPPAMNEELETLRRMMDQQRRGFSRGQEFEERFTGSYHHNN